MPRLDVWLVENGMFSSRQSAKRAIGYGFVTVDGRVVKPSTRVSGSESIIISDEALDVPAGYFKIREIDDAIGNRLVCPGSLVLDIGSSAGGFLTYVAERGARVVGIEISQAFLRRLARLSQRYSRISVIMTDAFSEEPPISTDHTGFDLVLIDVTTDISGTMNLVRRYCSFLHPDGRIVAAFKARTSPPLNSWIFKELPPLGFQDIKVLSLNSTRTETHLVAVYKPTGFIG